MMSDARHGMMNSVSVSEHTLEEFIGTRNEADDVMGSVLSELDDKADDKGEDSKCVSNRNADEHV